MADDLRIYELTDTQASYSSAIFLAVDDATFSNTKKVAMSTIYPLTNTLSSAGDFNPATSVLRLNNGSGTETKVTVNDLINDSDVRDTIRDLFTETSWLDGNPIYGGIDLGTFICKVKQWGKMVVVTGVIKLDTQPAANAVLITLPATIKTVNQDQYFHSADDTDNETIEMYLDSGTQNIKSRTSSADTATTQTFSFTYIADNYLS